MTNLSDLLSVAIGLVFMFLLLSLLNSWILESIATVLKWRAQKLMALINTLLDDDKTLDIAAQKWARKAPKLLSNAEKFYDHPLIKSLSIKGQNPSYVSARDFATVLLDIFTNSGTSTPTKPEEYLATLEAKINKEVKKSALNPTFQTMISSAKMKTENAEERIAALREAIEAWFNSGMERASGWYKRHITKIGLVVGILIATVLNADTIGIARVLWQDTSVRAALSDMAVAYVEKGTEDKAYDTLEKIRQSPLPLGWSGLDDGDPETPYNPRDVPITFWGFVVKIFGILITGYAISQGSPIWFDVLDKLVNIRGSGKKPKTEGEDEK